MAEEVLFTITKECLETGMRGYPVGYCTTSFVEPEQGLFYIDTPIQHLTEKQPEEIIYLLYYGKHGTAEEIKAFTIDLQKRTALSRELVEHIQLLPRKGSPMKLFASALLLAGMIQGTHDYREDCLNIIAKVPALVATVINHHAGWGSTPPFNPAFGYIENFVAMLQLPHKKGDNLLTVMKLFNILHYDHGGGNLSTFVGKAVASGLEDMYGSLAASICALAGPRHGRANQDCLEFVQSVLHQVGENATLEQVEAFIREKLHKGELVFGFGHAVLRVEDPRAAIFYEFCMKHYPSCPLVRIARLLRECVPRVLQELHKVADPYSNVDAISGIALATAGFSYPEYFPLLFGLSRMVGIARQIVYERCEARNGKGTPIIRPKYYFKGREKSEW